MNQATRTITRFMALTISLGTLAGCGVSADNPSGLVYDGMPSQTISGQAVDRSVRTDDSDLGGPSQKTIYATRLQREVLRRVGSLLVFPTRGRSSVSTLAPLRGTEGGTVTVTGQLQYFDPRGSLLPAENVTVSAAERQGGQAVASSLVGPDGRWILAVDRRYTGKHLSVTFTLANNFWDIQGESSTYAWQGPEIAGLQGDTDTGARTLEKDTTNAQAAFIHEIYNRYLRLFAREKLALSWWNRSIDTYWPADGDYYAGSVNLTHADHWDVNGHEIGHAITFTGTNTRAGGGQHYIDRCYTPSLAWSEGVASFFSAAVSLDPGDPDAKFEFLVPRRAPIRIENVPEDVCKGNTNEWRVAAAMWDVYDRHDDGLDKAGLSFGTIWQALHEAPSISSVNDVFPELLKKAGGDKRTLLRDAFRQNTIDI